METLTTISSTQTMPETPYEINVSEENLQHLRQKLALAVLPDELEDAQWDYGAPLSDIRRLIARWKDGYDWRKHEAQLNAELPQFTRDIDVDGFGTLNIHYVHQKSTVAAALPLLFVHGWPGSFLEARKILPLLSDGSGEYPAFHVVVLSLPGFAFSETPRKKGFAQDQYAEVGNKLMLSLGYNEYVTHGGDWGYLITRRIAQLYGHKHSKAWHTTFPMATRPTLTHKPLLYLRYLLFGYNKVEKEGLQATQKFLANGGGYREEQGTKPQTLGYSLADSPVGLLAWIYEKLVSWTDQYPWDDDEVLTWISIYWFSRAGPAASLRIYYETNKGPIPAFLVSIPTTIPLGYSYFPKEHIIFPRRWLKASNLVFQSDHAHDGGGHFPAYEKSKELAADLRKMFGRGGPAFGVVSGASGHANSETKTTSKS